MIELIHQAVSCPLDVRLTRLVLDIRMLRLLPQADIKAHYTELEWVRDNLSQILDRADGKS